MQIKSVEIKGMRNVVHKKYDFGSVTYLAGPNGAGKSTVLNAIQLALLGYIPGTDKRNSSIMEHSNCPKMEVTVMLQEDEQEIEVHRTVSRKGNSCSQNVEIYPEGIDLEGIVSSLSLPVFNWNDFTSMTSNNLKSWFIEFIPGLDNKVDWNLELERALPGEAVLNPNVVDEYSKKVSALQSETAVEQVVKANKLFKDELSYNKAALTEKENAISALYDQMDASVDSSDISSLMDTMEQLAKKYTTAQNGLNSAVECNSKIKADQKIYDSFMSSVPSDKEVSDASSEIKAIQSYIQATQENITNNKTKLNELNEDVESIRFKHSEIKAQIDSMSRVVNSDGSCPYTSSECRTIGNLKPKYKEACEGLQQTLANLQNSINEKEKEATKVKSYLESNSQSISDFLMDLTKAQSKYDSMLSYIEKSKNCVKPDVSNLVSDEKLQEMQKNVNSISEKYQKSCELLASAKQAQKYQNMLNNMIEEKNKLEELVEILNSWVKLTNSNGLQTTLSKSGFASLEQELTPHIKSIFGDDCSCKFNCTSKANSFSFGLVRGVTYIPYKLLSTGEKTLFTYVLMHYIAKNSDSPLHVMLMDDFFDHLDKSKFRDLVNIMYTDKDVQVIMAGVVDIPQDDSNFIKIVEL